jgi:hypothetical protein
METNNTAQPRKWRGVLVIVLQTAIDRNNVNERTVNLGSFYLPFIMNFFFIRNFRNRVILHIQRPGYLIVDVDPLP